MLTRVSSFAAGRRARWAIILAWLAVAAALAQFQPKLQQRAADESETFMVRGSESAEAKRVLEERFVAGDEVATTILYELPEPAPDLGRYERRVIADAVAICRSSRITDLEAVITSRGPACDEESERAYDVSPEVPLPSISADGSVALTTVLTADDATPTVVGDVAAIRSIVPPPDGGPGELRAYVTGRGGVEADRAAAVEGIDGTLMTITAILIVALLLAIYRSPVIAAVPLAVVAVAYLVAAGIAWGLVELGATTISGQTTAILIVLMFGAGTDYCLLLVARYREELRGERDAGTAMRRAAAAAAPAIVTAGGTVIAAMLVLGLADFNATREMGPLLALGIAVMVVCGVTLLPAVLVALGRRAFWPAVPRFGPESQTRASARGWARVGRWIAARPSAVAVAATAVLLLGAAGNLEGRQGLDFGDAFRDQPESVRGIEALRRAFPAGRAAPLDVVVTAPVSAEVIAPLAERPGVSTATWSTASVGPEAPADPSAAAPAGEEALVKGEVILDRDPFADRARELVPELRAEIDELLAEALALRGGGTGGELALLGGTTAEAYDAERAIAADNRLIVPLTLAVVFILLAVLLRSLIAPLYAVATVVLSFLFALGVSSLAFTHLFGQPGSDPSLGTFAFIFLVALGVDYNIFLLTRVREERLRGLATGDAVVRGLERTGGVITSAGLILAGTFCALMALTFEALFQFGFVIALGLLVDTFLVRVFLVPAIALLLGERNWWPWAEGGRGRAASPRAAVRAE